MGPDNNTSELKENAKSWGTPEKDRRDQSGGDPKPGTTEEEGHIKDRQRGVQGHRATRRPTKVARV